MKLANKAEQGNRVAACSVLAPSGRACRLPRLDRRDCLSIQRSAKNEDHNTTSIF
jgi:hypothetical protein